jgi:hypothetical protein
VNATARDAYAIYDPTACEVCGRDSCAGHAPADVADTTQHHTPPRLVFVAAADALRAEPPDEIVEGLAWAGQITVLVAESGVGKTFVALSLSAAVSAGRPWFGRRTEAGSVAYCSFEGDALSVRLKALREAQGLSLDYVFVVRARDPISPRVGRDGAEDPSRGELDLADALDALRARLVAEGRPTIRLVVVDTARASLAGSEDLSDNVAAYLRTVRRLLDALPGAAAVITHHAGWQDGDTQRKRERGSSAWRGNVDGTVYLEAAKPEPGRTDRAIVLRTLKVRDGAEPPPLHLVRRVVTLAGTDRYGRPLTSCVIEGDARSHAERDAERRAAVEADERAFDLDVLKAITERPDLATSADKLRPLLGVAKPRVTAALSRLVRKNWAIPGQRSQPYTVTAAGRDALTEVANAERF